MKKITIGLLVLISLSISSQAHASFLNNTIQRIDNFATQVKSKLGASLFYSGTDEYSRPTYEKPSVSTTDSSPSETKDSSSTNSVSKTQPTSFVCDPLSINTEGDDKINILFIPVNTTEDKLDYFKEKLMIHVKDFYSTEPFKSNRKLLNFYFLRNIEMLPEIKGELLITDSKINTNKSCPYKITQYFFVIDKTITTPATMGDGIASTILNTDQRPTLHEFGHSFGGLIDTYFPQIRHDGTSNLNHSIDAPNIDVGGCSKWCKSNTGPYKDNCNQITDEATCKMFNRVPNPYGGDCKNGDCCVWLNNKEVDPFFKTRCVDIAGYKNIGENCLAGTGCYYGGYYPGIWRSTANYTTIMGADFNEGAEYDAVSVKALDLKIKCCYPQKGDIQPAECKEYSEKYPAFKGCYTVPNNSVDTDIDNSSKEPTPTNNTETANSVRETEVTSSVFDRSIRSVSTFFSGIIDFFRNR